MQRETGSRVRPWDVLHYVSLYLVIHQCWKEIAQGMLLNVRMFSFHLLWQIHLSHNVILNVVMNEVVVAAVSGDLLPSSCSFSQMRWASSVRSAIGISGSREPQLRSRSRAWFPLGWPAHSHGRRKHRIRKLTNIILGLMEGELWILSTQATEIHIYRPWTVEVGHTTWS